MSEPPAVAGGFSEIIIDPALLQKLPSKILLGIMAVLPLVLTVSLWFFIFSSIRADPKALVELVSNNPPLILVINLVLFVGVYGPIIFYIIHAARNPDLADRRAVWIILIAIFGGLAMPIYWFMFVWRSSYYEK